MIRFEEVNPNNWRLGLKVKKEQEAFVSNEMKLSARAYAYRDYRSHALVIYNEDEPVGMALYYDLEEWKAYDFSQLFIDEDHQRKGYGLEATKKIIQLMREDGKYKRVVLCYIEGNEAAYHLYTKCGFKLTGERDEDEIIMELNL